jgi:F-type H+-transporting ATPase subunit alpha
VPEASLHAALKQAFQDVSETNQRFKPEMIVSEIGRVRSVSPGVAKVTGLPGVGFEELVVFPGRIFGMVFDLEQAEIGVVLLGDYR